MLRHLPYFLVQKLMAAFNFALICLVGHNCLSTLLCIPNVGLVRLLLWRNPEQREQWAVLLLQCTPWLSNYTRRQEQSRDQMWGLLSPFSPFCYFPHFTFLSKQTLAIEYHICIWQVSPQLSCGDTCHIWLCFRESNRYFCKIENFGYGEISERSFSNSHPRQGQIWRLLFGDGDL